MPTEYFVTCFLCAVNILMVLSIFLMIIYLIKVFVFFINKKNIHTVVPFSYDTDIKNIKQLIIKMNYKLDKEKDHWKKSYGNFGLRNVSNEKIQYFLKIRTTDNKIELWWNINGWPFPRSDYSLPSSYIGPSYRLQRDLNKIKKIINMKNLNRR